eukprot:359188-Chlamydomonas_euryale.AAC.2
MARHPYPMDSVRLRQQVSEAALAEALAAARCQAQTLKGAWQCCVRMSHGWSGLLGAADAVVLHTVATSAGEWPRACGDCALFLPIPLFLSLSLRLASTEPGVRDKFSHAKFCLSPRHAAPGQTAGTRRAAARPSGAAPLARPNHIRLTVSLFRTVLSLSVLHIAHAAGRAHHARWARRRRRAVAQPHLPAQNHDLTPKKEEVAQADKPLVAVSRLWRPECSPVLSYEPKACAHEASLQRLHIFEPPEYTC